MDKEMGERRVKWRYERLVRGLGLIPETLPFQAWIRPPFMADPEAPNKLLAVFEEVKFQPDVIIIDSFRRVLIGDENNSNDVNLFWDNISPLTEAGITLLLIHHTNRSGQWRGSTDIKAGLDVFIEIDRDTKNRM
jgi:archaellum biogenesis ATPase FlaH